MANRVAWYDRKWVMPTLAIVTLVSMPFPEDIRRAVTDVVKLDDWFFDAPWTAGIIALVVVLASRIHRATRTCEVLREQFQDDLAKHRRQLKEDRADHRKQLKKDLADLIDSRINPITDGIGKLQSDVSGLGSRLGALDSRLGALDSRLSASGSRLEAIDSRITAIKDMLDGSRNKR